MGSLVEQSSDEDISDSEMEEFEEKTYEELKSGNQQVKTSEEKFTCPYCPKKRKRDYLYNELLQHASGVGKSCSDKRSVKEKASHLALMKYLEKDILSVSSGGTSSKVAEEKKEEEDTISANNHDKFVWPWKGIVVNIPTRRGEDGRFVGGSGSKLRDELISRGFNPTRVVPLWNYRGHSGTAVVEFNKGWPGLHNAISFERDYESDQHGRKDWAKADGTPKTGLYAWVAREEDYKSSGIIGDHLRKVGDLKTIAEMQEEEDRKQHKLVSNLTYIIEEKHKHCKDIEDMCKETSNNVNELMIQNDKLHQSYNEELKKLQTNAYDHYQRIFSDHERLKSQLQSQKKELELRGKELEQREAKNESERKKLSDEIAENAQKNSSLQMASLEQQRADEKVLRLAEDQKREKEKLHNRIIQLERQLDAKQALELEIQQLKGSLNVMKHIKDEDGEVMNKMDGLLKDLREKEGELDDLESLNQTLIVKERKSNDELQEARKELINGLKEMCGRCHIGVKRMGELDSEPFHEAMKEKYSEEEAEEKATEICSMWEEYLRDPDWHPFRVIQVDGKDKQIIKSDDERLKELKQEMGDKAYDAVVAALMEVNEYNPSGRYVVSELWNYRDRRKANLKEGVQVLLDLWDNTQKRTSTSSSRRPPIY